VNWTRWFSRQPIQGSLRPSLRDVSCDTTGLHVERKSEDALEWRDVQGDRLFAQVERDGPDRPPTPWTLEAIRAACRRSAAARDGGIVSVTFDRINGIPVATAISKFPDDLGFLYEATVMIRFREALYRLTRQAGEGGDTGGREAITTSLLLMVGELTLPTVVPPAVSAPIEGLVRDPYDDTYEGPTLYSLSDDERLDEALPDHPLSKVRRWLASLERTLSVAHDLRDQVMEPPTSDPAAVVARPPRMPAHALGILYLQAGRLDVAEQILADAVTLGGNDPALDAPRMAQTLVLLGVTRESLGRLEDAAWAFEWAVRASHATVGDRDGETIRARANLGRAYAALGRPESAEPLLHEAVAFFEAGHNESELAVALNAMGLVRQSQHRHHEALPWFERALGLFEKLEGPDYQECATVLRNLSVSAAETGDHVGSRRAAKRAQKILSSKPGIGCYALSVVEPR
jgi:tetratricopeptide (TPR) repeat protein